MRPAISVIFIALLSVCAHSQNYLAKVMNSTDIASYEGKVIQYGFYLGFGAWFPSESSPQYNFTENENLAQIISVKGKSQLYLNSGGDACPNLCTFQGTFSTWNGQPQIESVTLPDGSIVNRVSGTLLGTFTYGARKLSGVTARFYFESYSATFADQDWVNAPGALMVEISPN